MRIIQSSNNGYLDFEYKNSVLSIYQSNVGVNVSYILNARIDSENYILKQSNNAKDLVNTLNGIEQAYFKGNPLYYLK